jgi:hypothetical protein
LPFIKHRNPGYRCFYPKKNKTPEIGADTEKSIETPKIGVDPVKRIKIPEKNQFQFLSLG